MRDNTMSMDQFEGLYSNKLDIEGLIFRELNRCDETAGTPLYSIAVGALGRTVKSHKKIKNDPDFLTALENINKKIPDPKILMHNARCEPWNRIPVTTVLIKDFEAEESVYKDFLAKYGFTYKEERIAIL